jgi:uncharacterized protein (DUF3820 family)
MKKILLLEGDELEGGMDISATEEIMKTQAYTVCDVVVGRSADGLGRILKHKEARTGEDLSKSAMLYLDRLLDSGEIQDEVDPREVPLSDTDPMPFGKHKGKAMRDVPASYFRWLWNNGMKNKEGVYKNVCNYVHDNKSGLQSEDEDGVWD